MKSISIEGSSYSVRGKVIRESDGSPVSGLQVSAMDKDKIGRDDSLGTAITNKDGFFKIRFDTKDFRELIFDRKPDIYFVISQDGKQILSTRKSAIMNVDERTGPIVLKVPIASPEGRGGTSEEEVKDFKHVPEEGIQISLCAGNKISRIHLESTPEGVSLALVGAASASLARGKRQVVKLDKEAQGGLTLVTVGAANS